MEVNCMKLLPEDSVLFLDDSEERVRVFRSLLPSATIVMTAESCIEKLQGGSYDVVLLDHDLGELVYVPLGTVGHGGDVVKWIVEHKPVIRDIVVHSLNGPAAEWMIRALDEADYNTTYRPFPLLKQDLERGLK
jgi:CheY-like chemotaxis protein